MPIDARMAPYSVPSDYRTLISDLRTFGPQNLYNRKLSMSLSDLRTFGLTNLRNEEPFISDLRTFGLEQSPPKTGGKELFYHRSGKVNFHLGGTNLFEKSTRKGRRKLVSAYPRK